MTLPIIHILIIIYVSLDTINLDSLNLHPLSLDLSSDSSHNYSSKYSESLNIVTISSKASYMLVGCMLSQIQQVCYPTFL